MFLTIPDTVLQQALRSADSGGGTIYGRLIDHGDVAQVCGLTESAGIPLGRWAFSDHPERIPPVSAEELAEGQVLVLIGSEPEPHASAYHYKARELHAVPITVIRPYADYAARLRGLFEVDRLAGRRVAVIGLGSGGALAAEQLARCGVGQMRLVDFDRLEVHNIARHTCGLRDIGRYKTRAVRDRLRDLSPIIQIETFEANILNWPDILERVVSGCDLVVAATDSERSKLAINRVCWPRGIPAVYGAAYNRAFGGDIFRAIPPDGACYNCFHTIASEFFDTAPIPATDLAPAYADPSRLPDLIAEPGLGMDAGIIALLLARVALMTLLRGTETTLADLPTNWLLFGNRAEWIFKHPLESLFVDVPKQPDCPTCNYDAYVSKELGMTAEQAEAAARQILSEVPNVKSPVQSEE